MEGAIESGRVEPVQGVNLGSILPGNLVSMIRKKLKVLSCPSVDNVRFIRIINLAAYIYITS
jgi:hypothetical protein